VRLFVPDRTRYHPRCEGKDGSFGLWTKLGPFDVLGSAVAWLRWANHGSTRAAQHIQSRVRGRSSCSVSG
jgi:hypothetical protein